MTAPAAAHYELGVDIGGTFTDVYCRSNRGELRLVKIPTTRADPSAGVKRAIEYMTAEWAIAPERIARFVHGTTVATNAVLERKGARIGLITTQGFKDTLEIGRQNRHDVYRAILKPETPAFLVPGALRREVAERVAASGEVLVPLDEDAVERELAHLVAQGVEAVAVLFLFSHLHPHHERRVAEIARARHPALMISLSSEVDPAFREYERTCITAFDAYLKPVVDRYLESMESELEASRVGAPLQIMQSRGGVASSRLARLRPVRLFLSGPAAGVVGGSMAGAAAGHEDVITIDIGGTSADIALVTGGRPLIGLEGKLDGYAVRVPMVDVNAIGAGGGSIAWLDAAGSLRVGPASAGSEPGPACYGRGGDRATVTDASIVLGYIDPRYFAGGSVALRADLARSSIERNIALPLSMSVEQAALGIHRVVNANMAEGMRFVSVKRGIDPRRYTLVPLGGAGPVHATVLARELGIRRIVVPRYPGVLSACGLLAAPTEHEAATAFHAALEQVRTEDLAREFAALAERCNEWMRREGVAPSAATTLCFADVRYIGQSHHLEIAIDMQENPLQGIRRDFLSAHDRIYGHATHGPIELVNLRVVQQAPAPAWEDSGPATAAEGRAEKAPRPALFEGGGSYVEARVFERAGLPSSSLIDGPAIIEQGDTTTVVEPGWRVAVDACANLIMTPSETA